jgi:hypothetical protein
MVNIRNKVIQCSLLELIDTDVVCLQKKDLSNLNCSLTWFQHNDGVAFKINWPLYSSLDSVL